MFVGKKCLGRVILSSFIALLSISFALSAMAAVQAPVTDIDITDAVEDELLLDEVVPFDEIDVSTRDGIVTLTGNVGNLLVKERAVRIVKTVRGVTAVVDKISVVHPIDRTDREIEADIREALLFNPATEAYEVEVKVDAFKAILSGTVDSWREKMTAESVAKGVRGVTELIDPYVDDFATDGYDWSDDATGFVSDVEMEANVENQLFWSPFVDSEDISVSVSDGIVVLSGSVGTKAEKKMAAANAYEGGARRVVNNLNVR